MPSNKTVRPRRRGSMTVELVIVVPVLFLVVYVFVQLGLLMATTERLIAASQQGARVAARGGNESDIRDAVRDILGEKRFDKARLEMSLIDPDTKMPWQSGEPVEVVVKLTARDAIPIPLMVGGKDELIGRSVMRKE